MHIWKWIIRANFMDVQKQTNSSFSQPLDAGLRMEGVPAEALWDCVANVLSRQLTKREETSCAIKQPNFADLVPPNINRSNTLVQLFVFENKKRHSHDH